MNDQMELSLSALAQKITQDGVVDGFEVQVIRERLYEKGVIDRDEANFLRKISKDGKIDDLELRLLVNIISNAKTCPIELIDFAMEAIKARIIRDGFIDDYEVETVQKLIYGNGTNGYNGIDRTKANFLFDLNDNAAGMPNAPAWKDLFVIGVISSR